MNQLNKMGMKEGGIITGNRRKTIKMVRSREANGGLQNRLTGCRMEPTGEMEACKAETSRRKNISLDSSGRKKEVFGLRIIVCSQKHVIESRGRREH